MDHIATAGENSFQIRNIYPYSGMLDRGLLSRHADRPERYANLPNRKDGYTGHAEAHLFQKAYRRKKASWTLVRCSTRSIWRRWGDAGHVHNALYSLRWLYYHRKSYMSIVFHSGTCDSIHFQKIFSRCLSQLSSTNDLSEQRSHLILMISTTILVIEGFDPEAVHLHHAFSRT